MKHPRCIAVAATLASRGEEELTTKMQAHVERCFSCRAEVSDHRTWQHHLAHLRSVEYQAPRGVYPRVMADIGPWVVPDQDQPRVARATVAAAAVATAATAAAGTAVLFRLYRQRAA